MAKINSSGNRKEQNSVGIYMDFKIWKMLKFERHSCSKAASHILFLTQLLPLCHTNYDETIL
jgi:hypothetical protein